jgi:glycerophosphoryl diester phosphodiesterase
MIASHRGGSYLWPENSLLACRQTLALGVEQLELDVHAAADGTPVVMHDATLDRMTDAAGPVQALSAAALGVVRVRGTGGEPVPLLRDVAALLATAPHGLRLEVKADAEGRPYLGLVARSAAVLDAAGLRGRTLLMAFQPSDVAQGAALGGFGGMVLLLESRPWRGMGLAGAVALARSCGATEIGLPLGEVDAAAVAGLRQVGLAISAWGANRAADIARALELDLDAMTSDDPVRALHLRGEWLLRR